jgi:hypothetical protein
MKSIDTRGGQSRAREKSHLLSIDSLHQLTDMTADVLHISNLVSRGNQISLKLPVKLIETQSSFSSPNQMEPNCSPPCMAPQTGDKGSFWLLQSFFHVPQQAPAFQFSLLMFNGFL